MAQVMSKKYRISGWYGLAELDVFADGCQGGAFIKEVKAPLEARTQAEMVTLICDFFGCTADALNLEDTEEPGRVDVQVYENADGYTATAAEVEAWKAGKLQLWLVTYSGHLEKVTPAKWEAKSHA